MPYPSIFRTAVGTWNGVSKLIFTLPSGEVSVSESASTVSIKTVNDEYVVLHYTWNFEGKDERGTMLVASSPSRRETTIGWSDSWHQNSAVMLLTGDSSDHVSCKGSYKVEGHPDWHWRISLDRLGDQIALRMFNITPEGEEELAVDATYLRD